MTTTKTDAPEAPSNLGTALAAFQANLPSVGKGQTARVTSTKGNYTYDYADLTDVSAAVLPALAKVGLAWITAPDTEPDGIIFLHWTLIHGASGEKIAGRVPVGRSGDQWQTLGSAITYARRYCLVAATGVAPGGDDNDGADTRAGASPDRPQGQRPAPAPVAPTAQEPPANLPAGLYDLGGITTVEEAREMYRKAGRAGHLNLLIGVPQPDGSVGSMGFGAWLAELARTLGDPAKDEADAIAAHEAEMERAQAEHDRQMDAEGHA